MNIYVETVINGKKKKLEKSIFLATLKQESNCVINKYRAKLDSLKAIEEMLKGLDKDDQEPIQSST